MSEFYRVVMTCWDYGNPKPYADDFSGVELSLFPTEDLAREGIESAVKDELVSLNRLEGYDTPREKEPVYDSDGELVCYDYPFRADFDGDHVGIVRFWDGDDYQEVTAYNIHRLSCNADDLNKCSYYKYRGFWIIPNEAHTNFRVEQHDTVLFRFKTLQEALREIDQFQVELSYGARTHKATLQKQIQSAADRAASTPEIQATQNDRMR